MTDDTLKQPPPQPPDDRLDRLIELAQGMNIRLAAVEDRLTGIEDRLSIVENRLAPTNQLPKVVAGVDELNRKFDAFMNNDFREFQRRQIYDEEKLISLETEIRQLKNRVTELEEKRN